MPRNKNVKRTKKRQSKQSSVLASVKKTEISLMQTPSKLAAQLNKEINALKKIEIKLKNAISKNKTLVKNAEMRIESVTKSKNTPSSKKKLMKAKKIFGQAIKSYDELDNKLQDIVTRLAALSQQQTRLISLNKYLGQFEKEWAKSKKTSSKAEAKKTKAKARSKAKIKLVTSPAAEQPAVPADEVTFDDLRFDEVTELAS